MMNYHWYLKQEFLFAEPSLELVFDTRHPMKLHLLSEQGSYICYEFAWDIYKAISISSENDGSVAVIDGSKKSLDREICSNFGFGHDVCLILFFSVDHYIQINS